MQLFILYYIHPIDKMQDVFPTTTYYKALCFGRRRRVPVLYAKTP